MFSIIWFDPDFDADGAALRIVNAQQTRAEAEKYVTKNTQRLGITDYEIINQDKVLTDRTFRDAWRHDKTSSPDKISIDIPKAKVIAHGYRRFLRKQEFNPLDEIISKQIPGKALNDAEAERVVIRAKYNKMQTDIDAAASDAELKQILLLGL